MPLSGDVISWLNESDASADPADVNTVAFRIIARLKDRGVCEAEAKEILKALAPLEFRERPCGDSPWQSYFGPRSSATHDAPEYPCLADLTEAHVEQWISLASVLARPTLRARFADAAWELGKRLGSTRKDLYQYGLLAGQMYLRAAIEEQQQAIPLWVTRAALRSISLATQFKNEELLTNSFDFLMSFVDQVDVAHFGIWSVPLDNLVKNASLGTARQQRILDHYDKYFKQTIAKGDLFRIELSGQPWAKYFYDHGEYERAKNITLLYGERVLELADALSNSALTAHHLSIVLDAYRRMGLRDHAERVRVQLEAKGKKVIASMKPRFIELDLDIEEIRKSLVSIIESPNPFVALYRLANGCAPNPAEISKSLDGTGYIAHRLIPTSILGDNGLTVSMVGTYDQDRTGRITLEMARAMNLNATFFLIGIEEWKKKFELGSLPQTPDFLTSLLIPPDRISIYREGIEAFEQEDYIKCIHVLIPQVENSLRKLLELLGISVTKTEEDGSFELKNMNDVLRHECVQETLDEKLWYFLKTLYIDKRGMNLRNLVAHGIAPVEAFNRTNAALVIQSIVFLTMIREETIHVEKDPSVVGKDEVSA